MTIYDLFVLKYQLVNFYVSVSMFGSLGVRVSLIPDPIFASTPWILAIMYVFLFS
jgi:hypothetical protein